MIKIKNIKLTTTDVLRVVVYLSDGDISLPKVPPSLIKTNSWSNRKEENPYRAAFKFKKFNRKDRRFILGLLEKTNCDASEAVLKEQRFIRLSEILHPGEYKNQYPKSFKMFDDIRNNKVTSWYSKLNKSFKSSFEEGLKILSERPGELFRRIDWLVRNNHTKLDLILDTIKNVAPKVSNKVLYETYTHFEKRNKPTSGRKIMVKGSRKVTKLPELPAIGGNLIASIQEAIMLSLKNKFAQLSEMGEVWLDEKLSDIPLPSNMRSTSSSLKPIVRGVRLPIGNKNTKIIRAYTHWFDENGNEDLDLTVTLIGMGKRCHLGWNGTHNGNGIGEYSGDVRHRKGNCSEYVDINLKGALAEGYKYAIVDIRNFNGRAFDTVKDAVIGYMEREHATANEVFVPATIANATRLTNQASTTLASVIDLETLEVIHLDIDMTGIPVASANFDEIMDAIKPYCEPPKFSVKHLLNLHIEARGGKLVNEESAKFKFRFEDFSESYIPTLEYMGI